MNKVLIKFLSGIQLHKPCHVDKLAIDNIAISCLHCVVRLTKIIDSGCSIGLRKVIAI